MSGGLGLNLSSLTLSSGKRGATGGGGAYSGPGDIVSGAYSWYGLRAYSDATKGSNAIRIARSSDAAETDVVTLTDGSLDVASIILFIGAGSATVVKIYDQTGNARHFLLGSVAPALTLSGVGGKPQVLVVFATNNSFVLSSQTLAQPYTLSAVARRTSDLTSFHGLMSVNGSNGLLFGSGANTAALFAGTVGSFAASDNSFHAIQGVFNGASSQANTDGVETTPSPQDVGPGAAANQTFTLFTAAGSGFGGNWRESGYWASGFNVTQRGNMSNNQKTFWGF